MASISEAPWNGSPAAYSDEQYQRACLIDRGGDAPVKERIAALGLTSQKDAGRLVGDIMKAHKGQVEAAEVKRIAEAELPKA